jgi:hypothetical protein
MYGKMKFAPWFCMGNELTLREKRKLKVFWNNIQNSWAGEE